MGTVAHLCSLYSSSSPYVLSSSSLATHDTAPLSPSMTLPPTSPPLVPPINFSLVAPGVYRSGHPNKKNFGFLRRLKLRGIMYLEGTDEYRKDSMDFVEEEGVVLHRFDLSKEAVSASAERIRSWYQISTGISRLISKAFDRPLHRSSIMSSGSHHSVSCSTDPLAL